MYINIITFYDYIDINSLLLLFVNSFFIVVLIISEAFLDFIICLMDITSCIIYSVNCRN